MADATRLERNLSLVLQVLLNPFGLLLGLNGVILVVLGFIVTFLVAQIWRLVAGAM